MECANGRNSGCARVDAELLVCVLEVFADRARGNPQDLRDLRIGSPLRDEFEDLSLP